MKLRSLQQSHERVIADMQRQLDESRRARRVGKSGRKDGDAAKSSSSSSSSSVWTISNSPSLSLSPEWESARVSGTRHVCEIESRVRARAPESSSSSLSLWAERGSAHERPTKGVREYKARGWRPRRRTQGGDREALRATVGGRAIFVVPTNCCKRERALVSHVLLPHSALWH